MRITKSQLRQIIKESIQEALGGIEDGPVPGGGEVKHLNLKTISNLRSSGAMKEMDIEDYRKFKEPVKEAGFTLTDGQQSSEHLPNGVVGTGVYEGKAYFAIRGSYRQYLILPVEK
ncbi:MAG TPA: hypothetical protein DCL39_18460 [Alteromonas macleodii]|nr:hypothetical protein [Alteromonas macleodii]|tara:strand:- start:573 stop:920 length:348 start_codon:yes stop_codon:yes gene_type:complete